MFGLFEEHPRADREFVRPFLGRLSLDLDGDVSEVAEYWKSPRGKNAIDGLVLLGVRRYMREGRATRPVAVDLGAHTPVVISNTISPWYMAGDPGDVAFAMIRRMGFVPDSLRCERLLVEDPALSESLPDRPSLRLLSHDVWVDRTEFVFEASAAGFCRLTYGHYPWLRVLMDGKETPFFRTADGFVGVRVSPGRHLIEISAGLMPLKQALVWGSLVLLAGAAFWARPRPTGEA